MHISCDLVIKIFMLHWLQVVPLDPRVKELIGHVFPALLKMYETEDNK